MPSPPSALTSPGRNTRASCEPAPEIGLPLLGAGTEGLRWVYILVFLLGVAVVAGSIWYYAGAEQRGARAQWKLHLSAVADDRAQAVTNWLDARRADAEVVADLPAVQAALSGAPESGQLGASKAEPSLTAHLDRVAQAYGYQAVLVLTPEGRIVARSSGGGALDACRDNFIQSDLARHQAAGLCRRNPFLGEAPEGDRSPALSDSLDAEGLEAVQAVSLTGAFRITPWKDAAVPKLLSFTAPVFLHHRASIDRPASARPVAGAVMLRVAPESGLFPLLADTTAPTRTGETLLFSYAGREPAYLSPLRQGGAGREQQRLSLGALTSRAKAPALGEDTFAELTDYRMAPVFAVTRWIEATGWGLVLKIDRHEALDDSYHAGRLAGLAGGFLTLAFAGLLMSLWRQQQRADLMREQMNQERAILNLRGYAETIVASVPSGLLLLSAELRVLSANRAFLESFDLRPQDILGRPLGDVARAAGLIERAREVLSTGLPRHDLPFELTLAARPEARPVRVTITGIQIADEDEARLLLIIQDLTEEEHLDTARRMSEQRFRDLVQGLDAIVWEAGADNLRFSFVSQRAEAILGYPVERWLSERDFWGMRMHPHDRDEAIATCRAAISAGTDHEYEYRAVAANGRELWLRDIVHVVRDAHGRGWQLRGLTVDVSERKRAEGALRQSEDQLRQAQKMEAVGQLAGGIAHDFNNLLMVIQGDSDLILRQLGKGHPLRRNAEGIREASEQAAALTRQLLAFSRKQVLAPKVLDLNTIVTGVHKMLQRLIGETITLVTVPGRELGRVKADPGQIEQVIMNLAVNARDAMPDGGRLTIETAEVELDAASARQHDGAVPGRYVMLAVSDTGCGMDAEAQSHLFEPFFTTKEPGKGTGLGLSTVYGIVKQSGGHIWVYSEPGRGTTFKICFPRVECAPETTAEEPEVAAEPASGAGTILLVEDAARVRDVVREILEMNGYAVLEASHGVEAIELSRRHQGPIDLMVTDVVMPEISGREVAHRLAPLRPEMKVLYMSGYTDDAIVRHGVLEAGTPFLSKPFSPDALAAKVGELLAAPPPSPATGARPAPGRGLSRPAPVVAFAGPRRGDVRSPGRATSSRA